MFFFSRIAEAFKRWKRNKSFMEGGEMVNMGTSTDLMTMDNREPRPIQDADLTTKTENVSGDYYVKKSLEEGKCPDCGSMKFLSGPHGHGSCEHYMCAQCGRRFNTIFMGSELVFVKRI